MVLQRRFGGVVPEVAPRHVDFAFGLLFKFECIFEGVDCFFHSQRFPDPFGQDLVHGEARNGFDGVGDGGEHEIAVLPLPSEFVVHGQISQLPHLVTDRRVAIDPAQIMPRHPCTMRQGVDRRNVVCSILVLKNEVFADQIR